MLSPLYGPLLSFPELANPPFSLKAIDVPTIPPKPSYDFNVERFGDELSGEVFIGQLSGCITEDRVKSLLIAISNELQMPIYIGQIVIHRRGGICAFAAINSNAVQRIAALRESLLLEDHVECAWFAETPEKRQLLASYLAKRAAWPKKAIVFEQRASTMSTLAPPRKSSAIDSLQLSLRNAPVYMAQLPSPTATTYSPTGIMDGRSLRRPSWFCTNVGPTQQQLPVILPVSNGGVCDQCHILLHQTPVPEDCMLYCSLCGTQLVSCYSWICPTCLKPYCAVCITSETHGGMYQ